VFAFRLLQTVAKNEEADRNIVISPISASLALGMLNNGAWGQTQKEIQQVLMNNADLSKEELNEFFLRMMSTAQQADASISLGNANSIWIDPSFPVLDAFVKVNNEWYDAEVQNENLSDMATVQLINDWCSAHTNGMIPEIIDQPSDALLMLINALYFKGAWTVPFEKEDTKDEIFHNGNRSDTAVPTMQIESSFNYSREETFDLLELPYGNESFSFNILLPHKDVPLSSVIEGLNAEKWSQSLSHLRGSKLAVKLPRFSIEYGKDLLGDITSLGVNLSDGADFSLINPTVPLSIDKILQKTAVEITEEGSEAASVTLVTILTSPGEPTTTSFYVDRPFLFIIKEKICDAIFFIGAIRNF
jgi:serpin B